jgi:CRP-like cAMP-binding protein
MAPSRKLPAQGEEGLIPDSVLKKYGATVVQKDKGEAVFVEGEKAQAFFIVKSGQVKMLNMSEEGKEFNQGYFTRTQSFGEPPFFTEECYPVSAIATVPSDIWRVDRINFMRLLRENVDIHLHITRALSKRLIYKSRMLSEIALEEAEQRIKSLLRHLRETLHEGQGHDIVPFSRQQLADMAGLRVETVIRIIKDLEQKGLAKLTKEGKIRLD